MDSTVILGKAGENSENPSVRPEIWLTPVKDENDNVVGYRLNVDVGDVDELSQIATNQVVIINNQAALISKLDAIESLLLGGIGVNILSGGI